MSDPKVNRVDLALDGYGFKVAGAVAGSAQPLYLVDVGKGKFDRMVISDGVYYEPTKKALLRFIVEAHAALDVLEEAHRRLTDHAG